MQANPDISETQSLNSHSEDVIYIQQPPEQTSQINLPIHNSDYPSQPPLQSHPLISSPHLNRRHVYTPPMHTQDSQFIGEAIQQPQSHYGQFPAHQLPIFSSENLKEGEAYAFYMKDGVAYLRPYALPPSVSWMDQFKDFYKTMNGNAPSYYVAFLLVITILSAINIIPSLVLLILYSHSSLWLGFFLAIWMTAKGVCEMSAIYYKRMTRNYFELLMNITYIFYSLITILYFALDRDRWNAR